MYNSWHDLPNETPKNPFVNMTAEEMEDIRRLEEASRREQAAEKILHLRGELGIDICLL